MAEHARKTWLYFGGTYDYFRASVDAPEKVVVTMSPLGRYPLDITRPLAAGHFDKFDEAGLPLRRGAGGVLIHNPTTVGAFGLAHWDMYLLTADESHLHLAVRAAEFLLTSADKTNEVWRLRMEEPGGFTGHLSGLFHGHALSLLCRVWQVTRDDRHLAAAIALAGIFEIPVEDAGVLGRFPDATSLWIEEYPDARQRHVLNGMIYAIWGLQALAAVAPASRAPQLCRQALDTLRSALPRFDAGFWSWYYVAGSGSRYLASMLYHSLHIIQLRELYRETGDRAFEALATRFFRYSHNPLCRVRAAAAMVSAKLRRSA
jgi:heparosan-N-sulfate-glucuronate 5-epimerase